VSESKDKEGFDRIKGPSPGTAHDDDPMEGAGPEQGVEQQAAAVVDADLAALLDKATRERDEYLDMSRRVQADFENYKKRMLREQTSMLERAGESLVAALLPVLDAFDLAKTHIDVVESSPEGKALMQASALLADALAKEGLERIDAIGVEFDPTVHEAVEHLPAEDTADGPTAGTDAGDDDGEGGGPVVVDVLRAGYRWKGRVILAPMVRVRG
jgi:molecular chaperone GrpE